MSSKSRSNFFGGESWLISQTSGLIEVGTTSRGYKLYREPNGVGGHRYWSDAIGGGVVVYDTCLASREEIELALEIERQFERGEPPPNMEMNR